MADDDVFDAGFVQHPARDFAGKGAVFGVVGVLRADFDFGAFGGAHRRGNQGIRHAQHDVAPARLGGFGLEIEQESTRFGSRFVHFPVAGNNGFAITSVHRNLTI